MAITLVASSVTALGVSGGTTAALDTTGANLLAVSLTSYGPGSAPAVTDAKGNTYLGLTPQVNFAGRAQLFYCLSPVVGTGHTITIGGTNVYPGVFAYAFAGVASYQTESGATAGVSPIATGSVTPAASGALVLTGAGHGGNPTAHAVAPGGFTVVSLPQGTSMNGSAAYYVQPTAAAINATWSWSGGTGENAAATAVFLPSAGPAAVETVQPYLWMPA